MFVAALSKVDIDNKPSLKKTKMPPLWNQNRPENSIELRQNSPSRCVRVTFDSMVPQLKCQFFLDYFSRFGAVSSVALLRTPDFRKQTEVYFYDIRAAITAYEYCGFEIYRIYGLEAVEVAFAQKVEAPARDVAILSNPNLLIWNSLVYVLASKVRPCSTDYLTRQLIERLHREGDIKALSFVKELNDACMFMCEFYDVRSIVSVCNSLDGMSFGQFRLDLSFSPDVLEARQKTLKSSSTQVKAMKLMNDQKTASNKSFEDKTELLKVDFKRIQNGLDKRTSIMIRNIPRSMNYEKLKRWVDKSSSYTYTCLYMPYDPQTHRNPGYAFITFKRPEDIISFMKTKSGEPWPGYKLEKKCTIRYSKKNQTT